MSARLLSPSPHYYDDDKLFVDDTAMNMDVRIELVSDPMPQKTQKVPMRSIQEY